MRRSERAPPADLGALLAGHGRFRLVAELGRGASAVVFDVFDAEQGRRVALKLFQAGASSRIVDSRRWANLPEGPGAASLVRILDAGSLGEHAFYTMERIEGKDLLRALRSAGDGVARTRLRAAFAELTQALTFLHAQGFVHRDVKPGNVMLSADGTVRLLDLDIAAPFGEGSASSDTVGTPGYMSPEQSAGSMLEPASDLYALGVMLYEALGGRRPYPEDHGRGSQRKPSSDVVTLSRADLDAPAALLGLCEALTRRDPDQRPDAHHVLRVLDASHVALAMPRSLARRDELVGRSDERGRLLAAVARAEHEGLWLHVEGPPGRGKTTLVRAVLDELAEEPSRVALASACFDGLAETPYGALTEVVAQLAEHAAARSVVGAENSSLAAMFPGLRRAGDSCAPGISPVAPHEQRAVAEQALHALLATVAARGPLVVWLDDVEHASLDALRVIQSWVRSAPRGALLVTSSIHGPWPSVLHRQVEHLVLAPLSQGAARELAASIVGAPEAAASPEPSVAVEGARDPWSVLERARAALTLPRAATLSAEDCLRARVAQLTDDERLLLELASTIQHRLCYEDLVHAAAIAEWPAARALDALKRKALVRWDARARTIDVSPKTAALVREGMGDDRARAHHGRFLLVARGHGTGAVLACVAHAQAAHDPESLHAAAWPAARVARRRLAFDLSARLARIAVAVEPPTDAVGLRELGEVLALAGDNLGACEAYSAASLLGSAAERVTLSRLRAGLLLCEGRIDEALEAAREVLSSVGLKLPETTGGVIASLLWNKAMLAVGRSRFRAVPPNKIPAVELARVDALWTTGTLAASTDALLGVELTTRCTRRALRCGEPQRAARALLYQALNDVVVERPPFTRVRKLVAHAAELTEGSRDPALDGYVRLVHGVIHFFAGEPGAALEHLDAADAIFRRHTAGELSELTARHFGLQSLLMRAQVREARARTERFLDHADARGDRHAVTLLTAVGVVPALLFTEDDPSAARAAIERSMSIWPKDRVYMQHLNALIAELMILEYERKPGMVAAVDRELERLSHAPVFRAPPVRAVISCFRTYGCILEAAHARDSERKAWIERSRKELRLLERTPFGFAQRRVVQLTPQLLLVEGDREGALLAVERARAEFLSAGQDVTWTDAVLGRLAGTPEGRSRADAAHARMVSFGYRNIERAFAAAGADLVDNARL